jgi:uncharacterized protein (DUF488 family)
MKILPIYTIGYGNRSIDTFIALLKQYAIEYLVDVRSQPYSRAHPDFAKARLEQLLKEHQMHYVFMGNTLGGRPQDETCYVEGRVDYSKVRAKPFFQEGIQRLHTAWEKQLAVGIMCAELRPQECHRGKLISSTLLEQGITAMHIVEDGTLKPQEEIFQSVPDTQLSLFDDTTNFSRKKYRA